MPSCHTVLCRLQSVPSQFFKFLYILFLILATSSVLAQDEVDECLDCHGDDEETMERDGKEISIFVDRNNFMSSVHAEEECTSCHQDIDLEEHPDDETPISPVNCSDCHEDAVKHYKRSLHGDAWEKGAYLAPNCESCHGKHDILSAKNKKSKTYVLNIPNLCGECHKEGTPVSRLQQISEHSVLENYSQSIHGDGLFRRGLIVTAVCTSCHTSHDILPHEDPKSSINRQNIPITCEKCHAEIERVHTKIIRGELWQKRPDEIPLCIDCHQPHQVRRVDYEITFPDSDCIECHIKEDVFKTVDGEKISLTIDPEHIKNSVHFENTCIKCHSTVSISQNPVCKNSGKVDCSMCHAEEVELYNGSQHGTLFAKSDSTVIAPYCSDCHGTHEMKAKSDIDSPTFARNIPDLCGKCHRAGEKAAVAYKGEEKNIIKNYTMSIHGKGLLESGLMVTATCVDCHTAHNERPISDSTSTVFPANISTTCAQCHLGIYEVFKTSIHDPSVTKTEEKLPACNDCHSSHTISRVDVSDFRQDILNQCGRCHEKVAETYFETFHGKVSTLGEISTAKCYDCHGAHNILKTDNPASTLHASNIVETCKTCHSNSNAQFASYLAHATHHDKEKYPYLYYSYFFMTALLLGTIGFFGMHTLLWIPRAIWERRKIVRAKKEAKRVNAHAIPYEEKHIQRFDPFSRFLHILVILSFISLALTGLTIKFARVGIFQTISKILGGYAVTGYAHRYAAIITGLYFVLHLGYLIRKLKNKKVSFKNMFSGEDTLVPRWHDVVEFWQTIKWFLGLGKRPKYGRWTYWEKFDYFAVFWGVAIIGLSGLILWFPEFFTQFGMPGWAINVATIIHSDEALLATCFIFAIHFFNTHARPDKFPMDTVIFTGSVTLKELKEERPREFEQLIKSKNIKKHLTDPPSKWMKRWARIFGFAALAYGITIVVLTIYALVFLYN
ncbi:MAG: hypothetical protein DWQ05_14685 [Calditrichaeota bacterium]|nr:MAG: hypothetical protein DWQ05_14685 [Calditrichota bacterium]